MKNIELRNSLEEGKNGLVQTTGVDTCSTLGHKKGDPINIVAIHLLNMFNNFTLFKRQKEEGKLPLIFVVLN